MEKKIGIFTVFTFLLFAVSTARLLDQVVVLTDGVSKSSPESVSVADSDIVLPNEKSKSEFDETTANDRLPEIEKTQTLDLSAIDSTKRMNFGRLHPIKRHVFDKTSRIPLRFVRRHPCRKFEKKSMIPRSYGNDMISSGKTYNFDPKTLGDDQVPTKWLEFKHNYGHHHHHHHNHRDHHDDKDEEEFVPKYMSHHHKEKREKNGRFNFMKRIRKFLKHTFD